MLWIIQITNILKKKQTLANIKYWLTNKTIQGSVRFCENIIEK